MDFSLEGKVALVTGGSRGIGESTAVGFAQAGADVVVSSRKIEELERVADRVRALGRKAMAVPAHLGRIDQLQPLVDTVIKEFGRLDILVNNAGTNPAVSSVLDMEERLWDSVMNLNLKGLWFLSQATARVMKEQGGGNIINVASIRGIAPEMDVGHVYCVSKAGVIMATKVMAIELAQYNIRVNAIAPGYIRTKLTESGFETIPGRKEELIARTPMKRIAEPDEMAGTMVYLASEASAFMTGETLVVSGGILLT
jgi:NAD(P)-dependent dehydrogenase (short-subunit alcohol dehydrogenase family)